MFHPVEEVRTVDVCNHVCSTTDVIPLSCISGNGKNSILTPTELSPEHVVHYL